MFYTLRSTSIGGDGGTTFTLVKWEEGRKRPLDTYTQTISKVKGVTYCNCPSRYNPCKHAKISQALMEASATIPLPLLFYDESDGVQEVQDMAEPRFDH